jgi:hypothetical protein
MDRGFARTALPRLKLCLLERFALASLLAALGLGAIVSTAGAVVTIGSNLGREPNFQTRHSPRSTFSNLSLAPDHQAPGGIASPVNGTVVRWRIRVGDVTGVVNLRIIRPLGGGLFTGAGTSASVTPPIHATTSYAVQPPIRIGDYIGLDCCDALPEAKFFVFDTSEVRSEWQPSLVDGGTGRTPGFFPNTVEIALNADIEPTSAFTVDAITRNKKKGRATVTATVPNPGELTGAGKGVTVANAAVVSKTVTKPGSVQLLIKATGKKKKKLNSTGKVKVNPTITFTPTGGDPATQSVKVKLKKKL